MAKQRYGIIKNGHLATYTDPVRIGASEVFPAQSGRFVMKTGDDFDIATTAGGTRAIGAIEWTGTAQATDGFTTAPVQTSPDVWYELPATNDGTTRQTLTQAAILALRFDTCDVALDANGIQYAHTGAADDDVFIIVGGDVDENTLYVKMNPNEQGVASVA